MLANVLRCTEPLQGSISPPKCQPRKDEKLQSIDLDLPRVRVERNCEALMTSTTLFIKRLGLTAFLEGKHAKLITLRNARRPVTCLTSQLWQQQILGEGPQCPNLCFRDDLNA